MIGAFLADLLLGGLDEGLQTRAQRRKIRRGKVPTAFRERGRWRHGHLLVRSDHLVFVTVGHLYRSEPIPCAGLRVEPSSTAPRGLQGIRLRATTGAVELAVIEDVQPEVVALLRDLADA